jgi:hypothetical protein
MIWSWGHPAPVCVAAAEAVGQAGERPEWMEDFARTIDAAKKYVVSSTLDRVDWNAELVGGDLGMPFSSSNGSRGRGCCSAA